METGTVHLQVTNREVKMTATIQYSALEHLRGCAFAAFRPGRLYVDDERWTGIVGYVVGIPGGCEIAVDDERLARLIDRSDEGLVADDGTAQIPVVIKDPYFPEIRCTITLRALRMGFNEIAPGRGPRRALTRKRCTHREADPPGLCEYCFWRWAEAKRTGPLFGQQRYEM